MTNQISTQCPECDNDISVSASCQGEQFICPDCDAPLEVVRMAPLALAQTSHPNSNKSESLRFIKISMMMHILNTFKKNTKKAKQPVEELVRFAL